MLRLILATFALTLSVQVFASAKKQEADASAKKQAVATTRDEIFRELDDLDENLAKAHAVPLIESDPSASATTLGQSGGIFDKLSLKSEGVMTSLNSESDTPLSEDSKQDLESLEGEFQ